MKIGGNTMKKTRWILVLSLLFIFPLLLFSGCAQEEKSAKLIFCDAGWDSVRFHNAIARFIAKSAYGLDSEELKGSTPVTYMALLSGDADVHMELWSSNLATYNKDVKTGKFKVAGVNYDDNKQGIYVPRYVIEGDPSAGLAPMAPDLKTVADLAKYPEVFRDEENPNKGRLYGAIPGWAIDQIMYKKYKYYNLDKNFVYFRPGSDAVLNAAFTAAYDQKKPIAGYNWEPTWLSGKLDLVLLQDAPYEEAGFQEGRTAAPSVPVTIGVSNKAWKAYPEYVEFLKKYHTSSALTAEGLVLLSEEKLSYDQAGRAFLRKHPELLKAWLPEGKVALVEKALKEGK
jgi:glycine betaine/proline transport system substrate-binding protein